jgi:hypothetical protein
MSLEESLKQLHDLNLQIDALEAHTAQLKQEAVELNAKLTEEFESRQIKSMKLDGVGNFILHVSSYPKCFDKVALKEWLKAQGYGWETVLAFNQSKFKGFYNELLENQKELPPGTETYTEAKIRIRKEA